MSMEVQGFKIPGLLRPKNDKMELFEARHV
jgi:hypothetical protein